MTVAALPEAFEPTVLDEETELRALARALELAQGFSLIFARCNQPSQRQRLAADLISRMPALNIQEVTLREPITHLLDFLREQFPQTPTGPVFVSGLEYSLPVASEAHATAFIANLNAARNSFPQVFPCPLVLWVPEYVLTAILRGAPDFFSIRSGVYYFAATPQESLELTQTLASGEAWDAANLPSVEKQSRISAIKTLLQDYQALPLSRRDVNSELRLYDRLGHLYATSGQWAEAEKIFKQNLLTFEAAGDMLNIGIVSNSLGVIYRHQGLWAEATRCFEQVLNINRQLGDRLSEGQTLNNLGIVYEEQRQWSKATDCYEQGLAICREYGDMVGEEQALNNLGSVLQNQGKLEKTETTLLQSLHLSRELNDVFGEGYILSNLAVIYTRQGRLTEAEQVAQKYQTIMQYLGNSSEEGRAWRSLATLRALRGDGLGALAAGRQSVAMLEKTEDSTALKRMQEDVEELERILSAQGGR